MSVHKTHPMHYTTIWGIERSIGVFRGSHWHAFRLWLLGTNCRIGGEECSPHLTISDIACQSIIVSPPPRSPSFFLSFFSPLEHITWWCRHRKKGRRVRLSISDWLETSSASSSANNNCVPLTDRHRSQGEGERDHFFFPIRRNTELRPRVLQPICFVLTLQSLFFLKCALGEVEEECAANLCVPPSSSLLANWAKWIWLPSCSSFLEELQKRHWEGAPQPL